MKEEGKIRSFTNLNAWKEGHKLILEIYRLTPNFPKEELFGLTSQIRRCSVSITSNIAEGFGRHYYSEKIRFYSFSKGSIIELQNQLLIAKDVGFIEKNNFILLADQSITVHKMLNKLISKTKEINNNLNSKF